MKPIGLIICLLCGILASLSGQPRQAPQQRVRAMKIAYMTDRMGLTPDEAQKFWPIYNEYEQEQRKVREKYRPAADISAMPDTELERFVAQHLDMQEEELRLKREYFARLKRVLPIRKMAIFLQAETEFNRKLLQALQQPQSGPPSRR